MPPGEDEVRVRQATAVRLRNPPRGLEDPWPRLGVVEVLLCDLAQRVALDHAVSGNASRRTLPSACSAAGRVSTQPGLGVNSRGLR